MAKIVDTLEPLHPEERDVLTFDFKKNLKPGETVDTIVGMGIFVYDGKDETAADILVGPPQLDGTRVMQEIYGENGKEGVRYVIECTVEVAPSARRPVGMTILHIMTPGKRKARP